jgi:hypothetical protein
MLQSNLSLFEDAAESQKDVLVEAAHVSTHHPVILRCAIMLRTTLPHSISVLPGSPEAHRSILRLYANEAFPSAMTWQLRPPLLRACRAFAAAYAELVEPS